MSDIKLVQEAFKTAQTCLDNFIASPQNMNQVAHFGKKLAQTLSRGNKVISCGNGGSMCDAMHFAEELTGRFRENRRSLPAIAISDPSHLTCTANDFGFDYVFSRYVEGVGVEGDLLMGISTSGNSPNIINAVEAAKEKGIYTVALLGKDGGKLKDIADHSIIVPAKTSDRIQEIHIKIIHTVIELAEYNLFYKENK